MPNKKEMQSTPPTVRIKVDREGHLWLHDYEPGIGYRWFRLIVTSRVAPEELTKQWPEISLTLPN